jgi:tRNA(Ile)-lysidine synthase
MQDRKKVSDFFIDSKVPVYEKRLFPVLETRDGEIVWLCGLRIDERFKVTEDTRRVLKLKYSRALRTPHGQASNG